MADRLIHLNECALLMGISLSKAYRLAKAHEAPFENVQKYGSTYMVPYTWPSANAWAYNPRLMQKRTWRTATSCVRRRQNAREHCGCLAGLHSDAGALRKGDSNTALWQCRGGDGK